MSQRYIDLSFEESNQSMLDGGFQMENDATVIRLKVLDTSAKHYIEIEQLNAKHDKYCSAELPVVDGYAALELSRDYTNSTIYVQGVMKVNDICRKTPRMRLGFKRSINAIEELPESQPSWADSVESRLKNASAVDILAILSETNIITPMQQDGTFFTDESGALLVF